MKTKRMVIIAGICSSAWLGVAGLAQSGGAGGGSSGSGAATGASAGSSASAAASSTGTGASTATSTNRGTNAGAPNMTPTMPSHSVIDRATGTTTSGGALPPGLTPAPAQPGVSNVSGINTAELPAVSAGTTPIGPQSNPASATDLPATHGSAAEDVAARARANGNDAAAAANIPTAADFGAGVTTIVPTAPPAPHAEATPPAMRNDLGQLWVPGHYSWTDGQWRWTDGAWQRPPAPRATWVPGTFDAATRQWTEGHWTTDATTARTTTPTR